MTISRNLSILAEGVSSSGVLAVTNGGTGVTTSTGSGSSVLSASPTLTGTLTVPTVTSPAATALTIQSAGTTAMTVDTSQNVGIGGSPLARLSAASTSGFVGLFTSSLTGTTPRSNGVFRVQSEATGRDVYMQFSDNVTNATEIGMVGGAQYFCTGGSEKMRLDSSGNLLVGTTSPQNLEKFNVTGSVANFVSRAINSNASPNGFMVYYTNASPNANSNAMLYCIDSTALRFAVQSNGGISNYSANNVNLSDQRMKKDIQLAGSYLDKICAIPVKTFLYNDQTDNELNLGVIAQDVDAVAPELIDHSGWKDKDGEATDYLSIYQTDLQYALMKCIQELSAKNDALEIRLAKLEGK